MDEASEIQGIPAAPPPLQYASRSEAADALRVYRLVGMGLLLYYCGIIAGAGLSLAGYYQMGIGAGAIYLQQGITVLMEAIGLAGAVLMVRQWRAGAWLVVGVCGLRIGVQCLYLFLQVVNMRSSRPGMFLMSAGSMTGSVLQSAGLGLIVYLLWDHCRKRGAWG